MTDSLVANYHAIINGCGLVEANAKARVWATGRDRLDLIHRMSTNDLREMKLNEGRPTVLTNALARMIDRLIVINLAERALLLGGWNAAFKIRQWLTSYIFYNDQIKLEDASPQWGQYELIGPRAAAVADSLINGASQLPPFHALQRDDLIVGRGDAIKGDGFFMVAAAAQLPQWREQLIGAGAVECDRELYEILRIESGVPQREQEISEDYIPLEANLWNAVSFAKGCYIGQEIIARLESRGKLAKILTGVKAAQPLKVGGALTSVAHSPQYGWIGLAFLKPDQAQVGQQVLLGDTLVTVASLPFAS